MDIHRSVFLICEFQPLPMARCQFAFFNRVVDNLQVYSLWAVTYICVRLDGFVDRELSGQGKA